MSRRYWVRLIRAQGISDAARASCTSQQNVSVKTEHQEPLVCPTVNMANIIAITQEKFSQPMQSD